MLYDVRSPRFHVSTAIRSHVENQLEAAIGFARGLVQRVHVALDDVNAHRGGIDKACRMVVHSRRHGTMVAEARDTDLYVAVQRAAGKLRREIARKADRLLTRRTRKADDKRP